MQHIASFRFAMASIVLAIAVICFGNSPVLSQTDTESEQSVEQKEAEAVQASLQAIVSILNAQTAKREAASQLREAIEKAETETDKKELEGKLKLVNEELTQLDEQVVSLATGISQTEGGNINEKLELQQEFEQLIRPFVWILKSATENAREIEHLKRQLLVAKNQEDLASNAIARVQPMIEQADKGGPVGERLQTILQDWEERRIAAKDLATTAEQQLQARRSERVTAGETASRAFSSFFSDRGRNFLFGALAFCAVIFAMRILRRVILSLIGAPRNRTFPIRLGALVYDLATITTAFGTTVSIFNRYNDWLLTGFMLLLFIAIGWFILKSLPTMFEQVTLLLNLGAVQEGERVMFNGIPWRVTKLDLYTSLENPVLKGGFFTVPVRELKGLHSRPMDHNEEWFPTDEGDWVVLDNGFWAEVTLQSPESVQLREEGGAISYLTTQAFLEQNPKNVSNGYRSTIEFGIDYSHQAEAAVEVPRILRAYVDREIRKIVDPEKVLGVFVTLFRAGSSSLDFEIEVDVAPGTGHLYEPVEHALARIAVECCTANNWNIPFPQLTIHQ